MASCHHVNRPPPVQQQRCIFTSAVYFELCQYTSLLPLFSASALVSFTSSLVVSRKCGFIWTLGGSGERKRQQEYVCVSLVDNKMHRKFYYFVSDANGDHQLLALTGWWAVTCCWTFARFLRFRQCPQKGWIAVRLYTAIKVKRGKWVKKFPAERISTIRV